MEATHDIEEVKTEDEAIKQFCSQAATMKEHGLYRISPFNQIHRKGYTKLHEIYQQFEIHKDDVWICTFPKSGTRWMQELVWCIRHDVNLEKAKSEPLDCRVPFFDVDLILPDDMKAPSPMPEKYATLPSPRTFKCHLSYEMLPNQIDEKKPKIINVIRNPRDVCLSMLNHFGLFDNYNGGLELLADIFLRDVGPYYAPYFVNVLSYWNRRHQDNILTVHYEDMQKDLPSVVKKIGEFLDKELSDDDVLKLCDHVSIDNMKTNPMCSGTGIVEAFRKDFTNEFEGALINKGKTGRWKKNFAEETIKRFEEWEQKALEGTGLSFTYEV